MAIFDLSIADLDLREKHVLIWIELVDALHGAHIDARTILHVDASFGDDRDTRHESALAVVLAMQLALELMKQGSYQVEMSDEGMMTEDIEDCLSVLLKALQKCNLPAAEVLAWCSAMKDNDGVGFIAREPLESLRNQSAAAR